jgi:hypothetical protein
MTCTRVGDSIIVCHSASFHRLRTSDGGYVFLDHHTYLGPTLFRDRAASKVIEDWYEFKPICDAVQWFYGRGARA